MNELVNEINTVKIDQVFALITKFSQELHGNSDYSKHTIFVQGQNPDEFAPFGFLQKSIEHLESERQLFALNFISTSCDFLDHPNFSIWYEKQFSRKLSIKQMREIFIMHIENDHMIFKALEKVHEGYEILRQKQILINHKNLPVQLGEWYGKCIFGLRQVKSTSQRGFDFFLDDRQVEVKVSWGDHPLPKGVKIKKALIELCHSCILIYVSNNLLIRDICFLDADFVLRKFSTKSHTLFLKEAELRPYFFGHSSKHFDKIVNNTALMKFASPAFALKLEGRL